MAEDLILLGFMIIIIGFIIVAAGALFGAGGGKAKVAVGGLIGPIPFGFGNDQSMVRFAVMVSIIIFFAFILLNILAKKAL